MRNYFTLDEDNENDKKEKGYYAWNGLEYLLQEYELHLRENKNNKVNVSNEKHSIEHIFPVTPDSNSQWLKDFNFHAKTKYKLRNSIGNLLLISLSKNKELQNKEFKCKKEEYKNGNYSEVEVSKHKTWTKKRDYRKRREHYFLYEQ